MMDAQRAPTPTLARPSRGRAQYSPSANSVGDRSGWGQAQ
jgi:hypothetical protein